MTSQASEQLVHLNDEWAGPIYRKWQIVPLKHLARLYSGGTPDRGKPQYWEDGTIPWLNSGEVNQCVVTEPSTYITEDGFRSSSAKWIPKSALVMALAGQGRTKGMVAQLGIDSTGNQSLVAIVPVGGTKPRFLLWWLSANYETIRNLAGDELRDGLNLKVVGEIPCPHPPISIQCAIAAYLDRETAQIDALIAAKRRVAALLEERFTRQASAFLFDSAAYPPVRLKFICGPPTSGNRDHGSFTYTLDGIPCLRGIDLSKDYIDLSTVLRISAEDSQRHANTKLHVGDLVIVRSGATAGRSALVTPDLEGSNCVDLVVVRKSPALDPRYLAYVVRSREIQDRVLHESSGALQPHFNAVDAGEITVPMRSLDDQKWVVTTLDDLDLNKARMVDALDRQSGLLQERRQALITAAVTGQLDVRDVA